MCTTVQSNGQWVLWQVVARPRSTWAQRLADALAGHDAHAVAEAMLETTLALLSVCDQLAQKGVGLRVSAGDLDPQAPGRYCSLLPYPLPPPAAPVPINTLLREELGVPVQQALTMGSIAPGPLKRRLISLRRTSALPDRALGPLLKILS